MNLCCKKNNEYINLASIWLFIALLSILGYFIGGQITGFAIYQQTELTKQWDFKNSADYIYNNSLIDLDSGVRLVPETRIITIENYTYENYYVTQAIYDSEDKTSQISSVGSGHINVEKDKMLNVIFENELNNNDIISFYIKESDEYDIYLCYCNTSCNSPGYGLVNYDGKEGWYNITIYGLTTPINGLNIDPERVKIDYICAYGLVNNSYTIENTTYSNSATIDTQDFAVEDFHRWDLLTVDELLNEQNINYYYSTDSGENWNLINNFNLSSINNSTIRLRAELISDGANTPVLNSMTLGYITNVACEENWVLHYGNCIINDTKMKYYTDENNCGTTNNIPKDNGTYIECDYCIPSWNCLHYENCQPNNKKHCNEVFDLNNCYNITNLPSDSYLGNYSEFTTSCSYDSSPPIISNILIEPTKGIIGIIVNISLNVIDENNISFAEAVVSDSVNVIKKLSFYGDNKLYTTTWNTTNTTKGTYIIGINVSDVNGNNKWHKQIGAIALDGSAQGSFTNSSVSLIKNKTIVINATETTNTIIEITSKDNLNISISTAQYSENLKNTTFTSKTPLGKYLDIIIDNTINENITRARIVIYYNDLEIDNANIDENTLVIYRYNETSENWQLLNSSVNTTANYVYVELSHFSTYGVFGEQKTILQQSSSGGGGGGGGRISKSNLQTTSANKKEAKVKEKKPEISEEKEQIVCYYSLTVDLPNKISFVENDIIKGVIKNNGDCDIDKVDVYLNEDLLYFVSIEKPLINNISVGETEEIYLKVKKPTSQTTLLGFAVKPVKEVVKSYSGELISEGTFNNTIVVQKNVPINIEVLSPSEEVTLNPLFALLIVMAVIAILIFKKRFSSL